MGMTFYHCEECGQALAVIDDEEYAVLHRRMETIGRLPARVRCPECRRENEVRKEESPAVG